MKLFNKSQQIKKYQVKLSVYINEIDAWRVVKYDYLSINLWKMLFSSDAASELARRMADALGYEGRPATIETTNNFYLTTI